MSRHWFHRARAGMLAVLLLIVAAACGGGSSGYGGANKPSGATPTVAAKAAAFPAAVQRSDGKQVTLQHAPKRLVSLSPAATEIIYALGAQGDLAAVDKYADYPDAAKNFPTKVDAFQPNIEAIAALNPDLVFVASDTDKIVEALDRLNMPVLFSDLNKVKTLDDVMDQIRLLGKATGTSDRAGALIAGLQARIKKVTDAVTDVQPGQGPRVYHELDSTFYTASEDTFIGDLYRLLKAKNIAGNGGGTAYPQLTQETIINANPQVIVLADEGFGVTVDSVKSRPGWQNVDAVKDNRIYAVDPAIISRPGPRIVDALEQLAKDFYPQRFK